MDWTWDRLREVLQQEELQVSEYASQRSPFLAHLWPLLVLVGIPFYVFVGGPLWERWRERRRVSPMS